MNNIKSIFIIPMLLLSIFLSCLQASSSEDSMLLPQQEYEMELAKLKAEKAYLYKILDEDKSTYGKSKKKSKKSRKRRSYSLYIKVEIYRQVMKVYRENRLVYKWPVSTGRKGFETPLGSYRPIFIRENYNSKVCNRLFLKNVIFLKNDLAIFGANTDRPLKRGDAYRCIKLGNSNSKKLYNLVQQYGKRRVKIRITR
ncbi:Mll1184 protein [hydrothermal vent metagenome]|uniref:Mll1184 protein n=1 Tax=hydrothermal vent metagenome TaxID=652676 RepID=A0A1W1CBY6_9ZZZZ